MKAERLKEKYIKNEMVSYRGGCYHIQDIVYWIDRYNKRWVTSVELIDVNNKTIVKCLIDDVEEVNK